MKKIISVLLAVIMVLSSAFLAPVSAYSASKGYAQEKLAEIQKEKNSGFEPGKTAVVTGNCYRFVSKVCEELYGVKYDGEELYGNFRAKHKTGNYYTVDTYTTTSTTPTSSVVEGIISFFLKNAAPGDIIHYGAYTTGTGNSSTHTVMINSIDNEKMSVFHANYQTTEYGRDTCHVDYIYWDSFRKYPTANEKRADGSIYSMNSLFYNKMRSSGLGISINRATNYTDLYYLVGAAIPMVKTTRSSPYSIKVSWDEIIGALKYQLQYKKTSDSTYTTASDTLTELLYDVKDLEIGVKYDFRVRAYVGKKWMSWSDVKTIKVNPPGITSVTFTLLSDGIDMRWAKRTDVTGVRVYRSDTEDGTYKLLKDNTDNSKRNYSDKNIEYGKTYYYKFERYLVVGGKEYDTLSSAKSATYTLQTPNISYVNTSTTSADFNLTANGASDKFVFYVTTTKDKTIVPKTETTHSEIKLTTLENCKAYRFYAAQKTAVGTGEFKRVSFRALPAKVSGVKASSTSDGIRLSFTKLSDVKGYVIERSTSENGTYKKLAELDADTNIYLDTTVAYNTTYYYRVCASAELSGTTYYGAYSDVVAKKNKLSKVTGVKLYANTPTSLNVKWSAVKTATSYTVQYKPDGGKWTTAGTVKGTSKVVSKLKLGNVYYFRVKASNNIGSGSYSDSVSKKVIIPRPQTPDAKLNTKGIRVYWKNESYATGYKIYRSTSKSGKYSLVKTVANNTTSAWTDTSVSYGKNYYYKLLCYKTVGKKTYTSSKSDYAHKKYELAVPELKITAEGTTAELTWNKVEGAEKYTVQYRHSGGSYKSLTVMECKKTISSLSSGNVYYFRVKAVSAKGSSSYCTAQSVQF